MGMLSMLKYPGIISYEIWWKSKASCLIFSGKTSLNINNQPFNIDVNPSTSTDEDHEDLDDLIIGQSLTFLDVFDCTCGTIPMFGETGFIWGPNWSLKCNTFELFWHLLSGQFILVGDYGPLMGPDLTQQPIRRTIATMGRSAVQKTGHWLTRPTSQ